MYIYAIHIYLHTSILMYIYTYNVFIYIFTHTYVRIDISGVSGNDKDIPNAHTGDNIGDTKRVNV